MSFRRYEIILPTRYNDGAPVEQTKYWAPSLDRRKSCAGFGFTKAFVMKMRTSDSSSMWRTFRRPATTLRRPATTFRRPAMVLRRPAATLGQPATALRQLATTIRRPLMTKRRSARNFRQRATAKSRLGRIVMISTFGSDNCGHIPLASGTCLRIIHAHSKKGII